MESTNSSPPQNDVVQAIFDSLTRCFNPIVEESPFSNRGCPRQSPETDSPVTAPKKTSASATAASGGGGGRRSGSSGSGSGSGTDGTSSSSARRASDDLKEKYDADRYLHRKLEIFRTSSEELAELGIEKSRRGRQKKQQAAGPAGGGGNNNNNRSSSRSRSRHRRNKSVNTLVDSSDDQDEIDNLTKSHKRDAAQGYGCYRSARGGGIGGGDDQEDHFIFSFAKLLRDPFSCLTETGRKNLSLGLCFATPIRTSSQENIAGMSTWQLTAHEYAAKQQRGARNLGKALNCACADNNEDDVIPDVCESEASAASHLDEDGDDEEETITSASYFDQKYSHIVEENPPMPLFLEHRILVSEMEKDEIFRLVKRREAAGLNGATNKAKASPPRIPGGARSKSPHPNAAAASSSSQNKQRRPSPTDHIIVKNMVKKKDSNTTTTTSKAAMNRKSSAGRSKSNPKSGSRRRMSSKIFNGSGGGKSGNQNDAVPVGKSSSVSTDDGVEQNNSVHDQDSSKAYRRSSTTGSNTQRNRMREPDIVYSTAAI